MNIVHITPGAGGMYCGNCFRDNALVGALRTLGHPTIMVPLYLPMTLDEEDNSSGTPIFFGGVNVYLQQQSVMFRKAPRWFKRLLDHPELLRWASGRAAKTRASDVGALSVSMLKGEEGNQARELDELLGWLKRSGHADVVCLSNALLIGLARRIRQELGVPVVCFLQGEDSFLDALPESHRQEAWEVLRWRAREVDLFIAPSQYFARLMTDRLSLSPERVKVAFNGMNLTGYVAAEQAPHPPVLGFFARMCREKGLDTVVDAFCLLKKRDRIKDLRLHVGGSLGPSDQAYVASLQSKLEELGWRGQFQFFPNLDREAKLAFYRALSVLSVPARYGEAFGLYVIEAMASGVPVVQPAVASFPELVEATGGGVLCEPESPAALAAAVEKLLLQPEQARQLGHTGRQQVLQQFSMEKMAGRMVPLYQQAVGAMGKARRSPQTAPA